MQGSRFGCDEGQASFRCAQASRVLAVHVCGILGHVLMPELAEASNAHQMQTGAQPVGVPLNKL